MMSVCERDREILKALNMIRCGGLSSSIFIRGEIQWHDEFGCIDGIT